MFLPISLCCVITNRLLPGGQVADAATRPHLTSASGCSPMFAVLPPARLGSHSAQRPGCDDKSPGQPVLIGGPGGLYKGKEGGDWLCFTENIITPLDAGGADRISSPKKWRRPPGLGVYDLTQWRAKSNLKAKLWGLEQRGKKRNGYSLCGDFSPFCWPVHTILHFVDIHKNSETNCLLLCTYRESLPSQRNMGTPDLCYWLINIFLL